MPLSVDKQADIIDAFNTLSRYLDGIFNIDNIFSDNNVMVSQIYPSELQLTKANASDTEASFLYLHLILFLPTFIINVTILIFGIVNFPFLDGDVPRSTMELYIVEHFLSQVVNIQTRNDATLDLHLTNFLSPVNKFKWMPPIGRTRHCIC